MNSYESAFRARLQKKMDEVQQDRLHSLSTGSALREDAASTGQAYAVEAGYFQALADVAGLMREVEDDLLGRNQKG